LLPIMAQRRGIFDMTDAEQITQAATDALLTVAEVCAHAGVAESTIRRAKDRPMRQTTKIKLLRAIRDLSA
jgi:hypothetical protein